MGQAPQKPRRTEVSGRKTCTAVVSTEEWLGKRGSWHLGHLVVGGLWKSSEERGKQEAEE